MMGVMVILGYFREKNKLVEDLRKEKSMDKVYICGVLMERFVLLVGVIEVLIWV